jgi:hypothetical protein
MIVYSSTSISIEVYRCSSVVESMLLSDRRLSPKQCSMHDCFNAVIYGSVQIANTSSVPLEREYSTGLLLKTTGTSVNAFYTSAI